MVITTKIHRLSLSVDKLLNNLVLVGGQLLGHTGEASLQLWILGLLGQRLRPVQSEVEMTASGVQFVHPARWRPTVLQILPNRLL